MGVIYKLDFISGRSYIGQTVQPLQMRVLQHRMDARREGKRFAVHRAWAKYGEPIISVVDRAEDGDALNEAEQRAIRKFNTLSPRGYNLIAGGEQPLCSAETREKMSKVRRGVRFTEKHKANLSASQKGRVFAQETREKMSAAQRARDPATRKHLGPIMRGTKQSAEHIAKRVAAYRLAVAKRNSSEGA